MAADSVRSHHFQSQGCDVIDRLLHGFYRDARIRPDRQLTCRIKHPRAGATLGHTRILVEGAKCGRRVPCQRQNSAETRHRLRDILQGRPQLHPDGIGLDSQVLRQDCCFELQERVSVAWIQKGLIGNLERRWCPTDHVAPPGCWLMHARLQRCPVFVITFPTSRSQVTRPSISTA